MGTLAAIDNIEYKVKETFNFKTGDHAQVMHVLSLAFEQKDALVADFKCPDPEAPTSLVDVVGVGELAHWQGGRGDTFLFKFRTSAANKGKLKQGLASDDSNSLIKLKWKGYDYSDTQDTMFLAYTPDGDDPIEFKLDSRFTPEVKEIADPENPSVKIMQCTLHLIAISKGKPQKVIVATDKGANDSKIVGVEQKKA